MRIRKLFHNFFNDWSNAISRFPLFMLGVILVSCIYTYFTYRYDADSSGVYYASIIGTLSALALALIGEEMLLPKGKRFLLSLLSILIGIAIYIILPKKSLTNFSSQIIIFICLFLAIHCIFSLIPFRKYNHEYFLKYNTGLLIDFFESFILSLIFYILLTVVIAAFNNLFDLNLSSKYYVYTGIWIFIAFHSLNFVSNIPILPLDGQNLKKFDNRFFKVLVSYICLPVIFIYALIILAYIVKYFLRDNLDEFILNISTWYLIIGFIVFMFNRLFIINYNLKFSKIFDQYFPIISLPIILFYLYNVYSQITQKGVKIDNYYCAMLGVLAFGLTIYFIIKRNNIDFRWVPFMLGLAALFSIISGPINSWNSSIRSQEKIVIEGFKENGWIVDGVLVKSDKMSKSKNLEQSLNYLSYGHNLDFLKKYDKNNLLEDSISFNTIYSNYKMYVDSSSTNNQFDNLKYINHQSLPIINFKEGDKSVPLLNKYSIADYYTGYKVSNSGCLHYLNNNQVVDSFYTVKLSGNQPIILKSYTNNREIELYATQITYKLDEGKILFEDISGIIIERKK